MARQYVDYEYKLGDTIGRIEKGMLPKQWIYRYKGNDGWYASTDSAMIYATKRECKDALMSHHEIALLKRVFGD